MRGKGVVVVLAAVASAVAVGGASANAECVASAPAQTCEGEEGLPVSTLRAVVVAHRGSSYQHPGYSSVKLVSTPEAAYLTVADARTGAHKQWLTAERENNIVTAPWTCRRPQQTFHYVLTARGNVGTTVTAQVTFHAQISARWCGAAKAREEAKQAAAKRQHEVELEARQRQEEARERETASTCTNGTYVNSAGNTVCKPEEAPSAPAGATAKCEDGTYSFSESRSGTCSHHGGVAQWL